MAKSTPSPSPTAVASTAPSSAVLRATTLPSSSNAFRAFRRFNNEIPDIRFSSRSRPGAWAQKWFDSDGLEDKLACALLDVRAVPFKEVLESFEFFAHVRRRVRAPVVADLCCGHGLAGMLYGVFHRDVEEVLLVDRARPDSVDRSLRAMGAIAPWLLPKVRFVEGQLQDVTVPAGAAVLGVHACGGATIIDVALDIGGPVALLPCCHAKASAPGPRSLSRALGSGMSTDIHRTYRLEAAGYVTRWSEIPPAITPMNRVIEAWPA
jgi:hypothetical protein